MADEIKHQVYKVLTNFKGEDSLQQLISSILNYQYIRDAIPTRDWPDSLRKPLAEAKFVAKRGDYQIAYARMKSDKLHKTYERALSHRLNKDIGEHLLITSNADGNFWHFVNIKEKTGKRVLRRIVIGKHEKLHTAANRIAMLRYEDRMQPIELWEQQRKAFDVEAVTEAFYKQYREIFDQTRDTVRGRYRENEAFEFTHLLFNRLMFLYFIQRKGWLCVDGENPDFDFIPNLFREYKSRKSSSNLFYNVWLKPLFFTALSKGNLGAVDKRLPSEIRDTYSFMPYLNGGLFTAEDADHLDFNVPDETFDCLIGDDGLLEQFNFTVREDAPLDEEVAIDHDMLGHVYQMVVNEPESGIVYTPRLEVDFMSRLSLINRLLKDTILPKDTLIEFIVNADYEDQWPEDVTPEQATAIADRIRELKIVDHACGSGAFLVGMLKVFDGILKAVHTISGETAEYDTYAERRRIIQHSLYGVDIKSWAVKICELRLWLTLVVEADEGKLDLWGKPLLPNFNFNICQGDSLVEEIIPGKQVVFRDKLKKGTLGLSGDEKRLLKRFRDLKIRFYDNDPQVSLDTVEVAKGEFIRFFFKEVANRLKKEVSTLERALKSGAQQALDGFGPVTEQIELSDQEFSEETKKRIEQRQTEIREYNHISQHWRDTREKGYFLWDIDFAEIFHQNSGFDIVIGNPPYVRQEEIKHPLEKKEDYDDETWREHKQGYKAKLIESIRLHWSDVNVDKKADYYIYFYLHGLKLLKPSGTFCFITSNSWLDVGYGKMLQEILLKYIRVKAIIDNRVKRSFKFADVNTVISLFEYPESSKDRDENIPSNLARFVAFKKPFEEALTSPAYRKVFTDSDQVLNDTIMRIYPKKQIDLFAEGIVGDDEMGQEKIKSIGFVGKYTGNKWGGKYLRAPDIYFKILEKGKGKLVRLGDIAEVRRGITTGANEFFYLNQEKIDKWGIEKEFLKPVIKSPRECKRIIIDPKDLKFKVFMCHKERDELKGTTALEYIKWGESQGFHERPSCRGRQRWWDLGNRRQPDIISPCGINDIYRAFKNKGVLADKRLYEIYLKESYDWYLMALNSTLTSFFLELSSRTGLGEGLLDITVYELSDTPVLKDQNIDLAGIYQQMKTRDIKPIEEEVVELPDRKELDAIILMCIGLTETEIQDFRFSAIDLARSRLERAESV